MSEGQHARYLTVAQIVEAEAEGVELEVVNERTYRLEDLYSCSGCEELTPDPSDLDDEHNCSECAESARADHEDYAYQVRSLRSWR